MNASGFPRPGSAGTRSTGKPSRMTQVGEWAEADPDALLLFFVSAMPCTPLSWEGQLPYRLGPLA